MRAFLIARVTVHDKEKMQAYGKAAGETLAAHGAKVGQGGSFAKALLGNAEPHAMRMLEFPDLAAIESWFASPAYQALRDLRDQACDMELLAYEVPDA